MRKPASTGSASGSPYIGPPPFPLSSWSVASTGYEHSLPAFRCWTFLRAQRENCFQAALFRHWVSSAGEGNVPSQIRMKNMRNVSSWIAQKLFLGTRVTQYRKWWCYQWVMASDYKTLFLYSFDYFWLFWENLATWIRNSLILGQIY